jgi:hypothetical protein
VTCHFIVGDASLCIKDILLHYTESGFMHLNFETPEDAIGALQNKVDELRAQLAEKYKKDY